ncbi:MAG: amidohydrolase [Steroidobacteraceae bacterium]
MSFTAALVQCPLQWHDAAANRAAIELRLEASTAPVDLIVLPEMFTSGFTMTPAEVAEEPGGETERWLLAQARRWNSAITGSHVCRVDDRYYNRLLWVTPDGAIAHYDKRHLFRMAGEHERYAAGDGLRVVEWRGLRFALQVCYDLRFPVWSRRRPGYDYDALVYVANWPSPRRSAWRALLIARAIENQACVLGVNRIGTDAKGLDYSGDSLAVDPRGNLLVDAAAADGLHLATLDAAAVHEFRERFPAHLDADRFTLSE